ncbi:MAG TPA: hypothetical protein VMK12_22815, partial [Anaeromyxobacteraceae bacterium]|nr:hypothetical protein [Anaeromyxobacteraceae bacterium]
WWRDSPVKTPHPDPLTRPCRGVSSSQDGGNRREADARVRIGAVAARPRGRAGLPLDISAPRAVLDAYVWSCRGRRRCAPIRVDAWCAAAFRLADAT